MGPDGGLPDRPTQVVRHTCSGKLGIVKILRYIRDVALNDITLHYST